MRMPPSSPSLLSSRFRGQGEAFTIDDLRAIVPKQYALWVRWVVRLAALAYVAVVLTVVLELGVQAALNRQESYAAVLLLVAVGFEYRGYSRSAAYLMLGTGWIENLAAFLVEGMQTPSLQAVPVFIIATSLLLGWRQGGLLALSNAFTIPLMVYLGGQLGFSRGFVSRDLEYYVVLLMSTFGIAFLMRVSVISFARALIRMREQESRLRHSQKLEAVGHLAGGVSHDFNNLLTVVAGYADLVAKIPDPRARKIAKQLHLTHERGARLTRRLLTFARQDLEAPEVLDLAALVKTMTPMLEGVVREDVHLEVIAESECRIVADPGQMEQVVVNLVANARDAMPMGGSLQIECKAQNQHINLEVRDTGIGMSESVKERIFDPFFTQKPRGSGTGLGLYAVHGIVKALEGQIEVNSAVDEGTCFQLIIPRSDLPLESPPVSIRPGRELSGRGLILLAEDDEQMRNLVKDTLSDAGFEVIATRNGAEALALSLELDRAPCFLLSDVMMPEMTGVELLQRLRRRHPRLPFLFMSGYTDDVLDSRHFSIKEDLLRKPFRREQLLERVLCRIASTESEVVTPQAGAGSGD